MSKKFLVLFHNTVWLRNRSRNRAMFVRLDRSQLDLVDIKVSRSRWKTLMKRGSRRGKLVTSKRPGKGRECARSVQRRKQSGRPMPFVAVVFVSPRARSGIWKNLWKRFKSTEEQA